MTTDQSAAKWLGAALLSVALGGCGARNGDAETSSSSGGTAGRAGGTFDGTGGAAASGGASAAAGGSEDSAGKQSVATGGSSGDSGGTATSGAGSGATGVAGQSHAGGGGRSNDSAGGRANGGRSGSAPSGGQPGDGGAGAAAASGGATSGAAGAGTGTCVASTATGTNVSGTGPHKVTVETNADSGISEGTIFRPSDLGGTEKYPIFVWGEGGCSENGLSNSAAMAEIASHGYFVVADGTPNNSASRTQSSDVVTMAGPLLAYIDWAVAENAKPCSAYYQALDTTKIGVNGFSCGGLMAEGTAADPRITTWGLNSSGMFSADQAFYKTVHTPVLVVLGGSGDIAYDNGERDYDNIAALGIPIMLFSKALGHGGDLFTKNGGDFTKIDVAWLNWWLKGDETATGKGLLVGSSCPYCSDSAWEVKSMNLP
ncbi:MAG TPA: hypothetical protein VMI54_04415 [Polyangiaceae bacterium]|nr:hypothetical protein [Polyangiaceae bacterium]